MKTRHRDSIYKLYGRVCDTISVFCYQGAIFYVQMTVFNHQFICNEKGDCKLSPPENAIMAWLYIEIFCFYLYMISACLYIAFHQLVEGVCMKKESDKSDMNKTITDFVDYAHSNLIWFAFNTVLVFMPVICIVSLNSKAESLDFEGAEMSYTCLLSVVCVINLLQFIARPRLFIEEPVTKFFAQGGDDKSGIEMAEVSNLHKTQTMTSASAKPSSNPLAGIMSLKKTESVKEDAKDVFMTN